MPAPYHEQPRSFWQVSLLDRRKHVVRCARLPKPYADLEDVRGAYQNLHRDLDALGRRGALVIDLRDAPQMRNDPAFEAIHCENRDTTLRGFSHIAFVVGTPSGRLQLERMGKEDGRNWSVLLGEAELQTWLKALRDTP